MAEKDPAQARNVINKCIDTMKEIKDPGERIAPWDAILDAAALIKDEPLIRETLDRALADAAALYKLDAAVSKDRDNVALPEYWPSTTAYRRIVMRAAKILQTDAEPLLHKIADPNLNLLARIAMAQALLGREPKTWPIYTPRRMPAM